MWILCQPSQEEKKEAKGEQEGKKEEEEGKKEEEENKKEEIEEWECELLKLIGEECESDNPSSSGSSSNSATP